jgi:PAS domain S-box-containing protein
LRDRDKSKEQMLHKPAVLQNKPGKRERFTSPGCLRPKIPSDGEVKTLEEPDHPCRIGSEEATGSEARYRALTESLHDGIYILDTEGRFTFVNQLLAERSGFPREWYIGKSFYEVISPRYHDFAKKNLAAIMRGEKGSPHELAYLSPSGKEAWIEVSVTPLWEGGRITGLLGISRDIGWRKRAEEELRRHRDHLEQLVMDRTAELRESERKYRDLVDTAPIGVYQTTPAGETVYVNETCAHMLEFESAEELISTDAPSRFRRPEDRDALIRTLKETGRIRNHEVELITKTGRPLNVLLSTTLKGSLMSGMMIDITERKKAEKDLKKEREVFFTILENDPSGIALIDGNGVYQYVNPEFSAITGYTLEDVPTGKVWFQKAYPDESYRNMVIRVWRENKLPDGRSLNVEFRIRCKDGSQKDIEFRTTHLTKGTVTVLNDVTRRKEVERALHESEEKYRSIFENAMEGIFQTTPGGRFLSVNPTLVRIYGYESPQELIERITNIEEQMYVNPEDRARLKDLYRKQGFVERFETQLYRKDGSKVWISMNAHTVTDRGGRVLHYEGTVEDISTRKEKESVEAQLRQSQKMEALGTLAGGIAHDFNNILIGIIGFSEMLLDDVAPEDPTHRKLELISKSAKRGCNLVRQILAFSRKGETDKKPVGMGSLIREVTELLRATTPSTVEIQERILTEEDMALVDQVQIHQVLLNLCTNAVHAIGARSGIIEINLTDEQPGPNDHLVGKVNIKGPYVKLTVSDTGCGMSAEVMEKIFDPFFTTKNPGEGTGMGLSVVHGIIKGHDGLISVRSKPRRGSTFSVFLPRLKPKPAPLAKRAPPIPRGRGRILFVDDEEMIAEMTKERLERLGYAVTVATDARKALDLFSGDPHAFDLVITDYAMPGMTGTDLAHELAKTREDIPVILCSGLDETVPAGKMKKMGIKGFLIKPVLKEDLARQVHTVLKGADARKPGLPHKGPPAE